MRIALFYVMLMSYTVNSFAMDFGQKGPVYPVKETNLLDYIYERLNLLYKKDRLQELQKQYIQHIEQSVTNPKGQNLPKALTNSTRVFDPSLVLPKDITNEKGDIIAKAGTKINPLDYIKLSKQLIFINANREDEINYAKKISEDTYSKIILVNGNIKNANAKLGVPVYFDQESNLIKVRRFDGESWVKVGSDLSNTPNNYGAYNTIVMRQTGYSTWQPAVAFQSSPPTALSSNISTLYYVPSPYSSTSEIYPMTKK